MNNDNDDDCDDEDKDKDSIMIMTTAMIRIMMMIAFTDANVYSCIDLYVIKSIVLNGCDLVIFSRARSLSVSRNR